MPRQHIVKTSFTSGEISPQLLGRGDLRAYDNGAMTLTNVIIHPTGGVSRRSGFYYVDTIPGSGRLIDFEFNTQQTYLFALSNLQIDIFRDGLKVATIPSPWTETQVTQLTWTQSADTLLITHPDVPPKTISRSSDTQWTISDWDYVLDETRNALLQPYYKYADATVTMTPSAISGAITLTTNTAVFENDHNGLRFRIGGKEVEITNIASPTVANADVIEELLSTDATVDWMEPAFSKVRGWPVSSAFHQDRLVIGGARDLPNRLWMSQSGDLFNFDLGEGLDNEGIEFAILSDQVNAIRAIFSGRHLQVFTSGAEWMVTGDPLTSQTVQLNRQTRVGSVMDRYIPPVNVDGATLFVGRTRQELREFLYTDVEQAYQANDLALLSRHLFDKPLDQSFDPRQRILLIPLENGKMASLTMYRAEQVTAWSIIETTGSILSVTVVGDDVYALIKRHIDATDQYNIERLDNTILMDSALSGKNITATDTWSGLDHLEGETVTVIADDMMHPPVTVNNGFIILDQPVNNIAVGLPYTHIIEPLPPSTVQTNGAGRSYRMVEGTFRLYETQSFTLNSGRGLKDVPLRSLGQNTQFDQPPPIVTGDYKIRAYGWKKDGTKPLWRIEQNAPLPFTLLSVTMEIKVND